MARTKNIAEWLDATAARFPDKTAFSNGKYALTFAELRTQARAIGSELARRGLFKQPVLVALDKEPRAIAAFLGAAYSGNFYVPLDLEMPRERVQKIIEKLEPAATINHENYCEFADSAIEEDLISDAMSRQTDSDLLYVLFTSGSTGVPKGFCIQHRCVLELAEVMTETHRFNAETVFAQPAHLTFDITIPDIYCTIRNGGTMYFMLNKITSFPKSTIDFLNTHRVNTINWVPTLYNLIVASKILTKTVPLYLENIIFIGETMSTVTYNTLKKYIPNAIFGNFYGPAETIYACSYYIVDQEFSNEEPLPIGRAYDNTDIFILNGNDVKCEIGETGELCVRGSKLACGYYNDPERTAAAFVQNPLNEAYPEIIYRTGDLGYVNERGEIMFAGRKDFQIKHSGHRIELGEIEAAAGTAQGVEMCACVYDDNAKRIVMFYTGNTEPNAVKEHLKQKLQPYMIPGTINKLTALPRTATGKIDRVGLKGLIL